MSTNLKIKKAVLKQVRDMIANYEETYICYALVKVVKRGPDVRIETLKACAEIVNYIEKEIANCSTYGIWVSRHYPEVYFSCDEVTLRLAWLDVMIQNAEYESRTDES